MKKTFSIKKTARYTLSFISYCFITLIDGNFTPFSLSVLGANVYLGLSPTLSFALYLIPFIPSRNVIRIAVAAAGGVIVAFITSFATKRKSSRGIIHAFIVAAGCLPFALFSDAYDPVLRAALAAITAVSSFPMLSAVKVWLVKGVKYRISTDEFISAALLACAVGYGVVATFGQYVWLSISLFVILLSSSVLPTLTPLLLAVIVALPPALYYFDFTPISVYALLSLVCIAFSKYSRLLVGIGVSACATALYFLTSAFVGMEVYESFFILFPVIVYLFIPTDYLKRLNLKLKLFKSDNLGRYNVNRNRAAISGKLYELSAAFDEMSSSMEKFGNTTAKEDDFKSKLRDEITYSVCSVCPSALRCRKNGVPDPYLLDKLITLGTAKGDIKLVDVPKSFSDYCDRPEEIVIKMNELVKTYERSIAEAEALENGRKLIVEQSRGLSEILKNLASAYSRRLENSNLLEKKITDNLFACGIYVSETAVFGEGDDTEIQLVLPPSGISKPYFLKAINEAVGKKFSINARENLSTEISVVGLTVSPNLDAAFGVAQVTKADKSKSGDTHSITKLSEGKFLIALNDGMGSGKNAEDASATAISLVETFYKSGLSSELILSTVNKALTFNRDDDFTAMDIGVVNLFDGSADFIKIGTPYSFVITKDSVKIIEGSSLPLGILDEMKPTVCKTKLNAGDTIVFVSDGVSDAFGSATDLIDFLTTEKALNPKTLADNVMDKALSLSSGIARDDMTVFCVRLFTAA